MSVIDLDAAAATLNRRVPCWRSSGLDVGPLTWADGQTTVNEITTDRSLVLGQYSVGIRVERGDEQGALVLYGYGQCDLEYWSGDIDSEPVTELLGSGDPLDLPRFERILDRFERLFGVRRITSGLPPWQVSSGP